MKTDRQPWRNRGDLNLSEGSSILTPLQEPWCRGPEMWWKIDLSWGPSGFRGPGFGLGRGKICVGSRWLVFRGSWPECPWMPIHWQSLLGLPLSPVVFFGGWYKPTRWHLWHVAGDHDPTKHKNWTKLTDFGVEGQRKFLLEWWFEIDSCCSMHWLLI